LANGRINKPAGRNSNTSKQEIVIRVDRPVVVDATNHIAGRLASNVAKLLLQGQRVTVVNCEKIMMSGKRETQIREYREFLEINSIINYKHGPVHYRRPDTLMAKMIRQMLPFDRKPSGKLAFARLRTYIGAPNDTKPIEKIQFEKALITRAASNYTPLAEICRVIGWTE
jgi:large subunit ribosomal protein L13